MSQRRKIATRSSADLEFVAKVYRDSEWDEFRVTFWRNGSKLPDADYHTPDKDDAIGIAEEMVAKHDARHG